MNKLKIAIAFLFCMMLSFALFAKGGHGDKHKKHFVKLDKNKDGKISKEEWMKKFSTIDKNGDGFIDHKEMKEHHKKMKKHH